MDREGALGHMVKWWGGGERERLEKNTYKISDYVSLLKKYTQVHKLVM